MLNNIYLATRTLKSDLSKRHFDVIKYATFSNNIDRIDRFFDGILKYGIMS